MHKPFLVELSTKLVLADPTCSNEKPKPFQYSQVPQ